ncbi:DUF4190 domain-containing protein [Streptomyces sp. NPDC048290]|uniref:DUF4190 domain-containing protein n=1 Tax=Streptomyces sp. NPDC048290 TaxID=3155811 RepID=UPI00341B298E
MTDPKTPGGTDGNGGYDPWAPPEHRQPGDADRPSGPPPPSVHDQATMAAMPAAGFPPPAAPGGPSPYDTAGHAPYDTTGAGAVPPPPAGPGAAGGYGYPGAGYPQGDYPLRGYGYPGALMPPQNGMGTAAMVLGILACCLFCVYGVVSVILGILAIVFGIKGKKRAEQGIADNRGQAQAGLITGIIGLILGVATIVLLIVGFATAISEFEEEDPYYDDPYYGAYSAPLDITRGH